jgi:triosephosphate isomerase
MRQPLVAGNWKMNGSRASVKELVEGLKAGIGAVTNAEVAVCPPFVFLADVQPMLEGSGIALGAQNCASEDFGAFTGEVAAPMLADFGCRYVIVGHSERRSLYGESDEAVAIKFAKVQAHGMTPILCVGETLGEREQGVTEQVVERQLNAVIQHSGIAALTKAVVAYEPVWAIGTGVTATPEQAQEVHSFVRRMLGKLDAGVAEGLRILYGGSMKGSNAAELIGQADVDGGLIGGASLKADEFLTICRAG